MPDDFDEEICAHFAAQQARDLEIFVGGEFCFPPSPAPSQLHKTQEGRIIRVIADETIASRDSIC